MIYSKLPAFVLGFHGCEEDLKNQLLLGKSELKYSRNEYDWLGHGIYFWENDPVRAMEWAKQNKKKPAVIGAVIDLGVCLNLFDRENLKLVKSSFKYLENSGMILPENKGKNMRERYLDCLVINNLVEFRKNDENCANFDTVRAPFWEGDELYSGAGFKEKNHVQICVLNEDCIKGYFSPRGLF